MSELNYKELQEKGVFDVPYKAFQFMQKQQAQIDELKHQKSLQELAINQISQANQEWRSINYEQQKRIGALSKRLNEAISIVVDDLEEFMRGEK